METILKKINGDLVVQIPEEMAQQAQLKEGDRVHISFRQPEGVILSQKGTRFTVEDLVKGMTPANRHPETDWGTPMGREVW